MTEAEAAGAFRELMLMWMDALRRRDRGELERFLAPTFRLTSARSDQWVDRASWIELSMSVVELTEFRVDALEASVFGDAAVVWSRVSQVARVNDEDWSETFMLTDVWVRDGGRWRVTARHSSQPPRRDFAGSSE